MTRWRSRDRDMSGRTRHNPAPAAREPHRWRELLKNRAERGTRHGTTSDGDAVYPDRPHRLGTPARDDPAARDAGRVGADQPARLGRLPPPPHRLQGPDAGRHDPPDRAPAG